MSGNHILILGGARSGKSKFAEDLALKLAGAEAGAERGAGAAKKADVGEKTGAGTRADEIAGTVKRTRARAKAGAYERAGGGERIKAGARAVEEGRTNVRVGAAGVEGGDCALPAYIATARALQNDEEMKRRILLHRKRRKNLFCDFEEPLDLIATITKASKNHKIIMLDCLTLWLANLMEDNRNIEQESENLRAYLAQMSETKIIFVSSEVGFGIVPQNKMARQFRDNLGLLNQQMAKLCKHVYFVAAGLPLILKGELL